MRKIEKINSKEGNRLAVGIALGMSLGAGLGIIVGSFFDNMSLGFFYRIG